MSFGKTEKPHCWIASPSARNDSGRFEAVIGERIFSIVLLRLSVLVTRRSSRFASILEKWTTPLRLRPSPNDIVMTCKCHIDDTAFTNRRAML
jgi:hypothetical protein